MALVPDKIRNGEVSDSIHLVHKNIEKEELKNKKIKNKKIHPR